MRPSTSQRNRSQVTALDQETLGSVHRVLLGSENREMPTPWRGGFTFRESGLRCGLRQREGGPCGVLAAVQAYVLRELYTAAASQEPPQPVDLADVKPQAASDALVRALAHIIWAARVGRVASVVSCKTAELPSLRAAAGEIMVTSCSSAADVLAAVRNVIGAFMRADGPGIALLLYSLTLTRGIAMVGQDADFPTQLIAANGYCSQELVNLVLLGRGHSNVFDGEQNVGGSADGRGDGGGGLGGGEGTGGFRLRGVPRRAMVGFLTLFEKQGYLQGDNHICVGSHYKRPLCPVYVVQSESHYSCLWALDANAPPPDIHHEGERLPGDPEPDLDAAVEEEEEDRPRQLADGDAFDLCYFDQVRPPARRASACSAARCCCSHVFASCRLSSCSSLRAPPGRIPERIRIIPPPTPCPPTTKLSGHCATLSDTPPPFGPVAPSPLCPRWPSATRQSPSRSEGLPTAVWHHQRVTARRLSLSSSRDGQGPWWIGMARR